MFGKVFSSMYDGSLGTRGPWEALVTFQQFIVLADRRGIVDMTAEVISRRTLIPLEIISKGIAALLQPDPYSRDPSHDGRRLEPLDEHRAWGWRILNYEKYRAIRSAEDRREYHAAYQRQRRAEQAKKGNGAKPPAERPALPAWLNLETWDAWVQIRPARARKPAALTAALAKLERFRTAGLDANEILATSVANGWQGIFPPDSAKTPAPAAPTQPSITCSDCGKLTGTWTGSRCDDCWRKYMDPKASRSAT